MLPPSVLFWGRRVYWAPVMLLVTALRQGRNPDATLEKLKGLCGVWRSTVKRWQRYFGEVFIHSLRWLRLSGRLIPPIGADQLPGAVLWRFYRGDAVSAMVKSLKLFALGP